MKYSILFFGTPTFALPVLKKLHEEHKVVGVITQPDKPVGRKQVMTAPPVKELAEELKIPVYQPEKASEVIDLVPERVDFIVTAAYGQYLPTKVLEMPFKDALNVHPSLLPQYRGATPMQSALLNGDEKTGVSIIRMVKEMDEGPIFCQRQFALPKEWKYPELEAKCSEIGSELVLNVLKNYHSMSPQKQAENGLSHCAKIQKQDGNIDWEKETVEEIFNKLRAFTPWPGVYSFWNGQKLSLHKFEISPENDSNIAPGTVWQKDDEVLVQTKQNSLKLFEVQLAGKAKMDIHSFLNGQKEFIGSQLKDS